MEISINTYLVPLTKNKFSEVDPAGWDKVKKFKWYYGTTGYALHSTYDKNTKKHGRIRMHRFLMNTPYKMETDHINGDRLDNRHCNLRICTKSQNMHNIYRPKGKSKYKGVSWEKRINKWFAQIRINGKTKFLGYFDNEIDAAKKFNQEAKKHLGDYVQINKDI